MVDRVFGNSFRQVLRASVFALASMPLAMAGLVPGAAYAQEQQTGQVRGRLIDGETGTPLTGAQLMIVETGDVSATENGGRFEFKNVPAGVYTLAVSYIGLADYAQEVVVSAAETTDLRVVMPNTMTLEGIVVVGQRSSQASALNQQRMASNLSNVISADQAGRFPDSNAAEAMQRVPGVAINREEKGGEGRYISIRGLDSGLNNFKLNGVNVAQTDTDTRRVPLDVVQAGALSKIVVNKTLLPDMDGDGIGGSVELETGSAFDLNERLIRFNLEGNYNDFAEDLGGKVSATFGDTFGARDEFGVLISGTYNKRQTMGYNNLQDEEYIPYFEQDEGEPIDMSGDNTLIPWWFGLGNFDNERENIGASIALDYRLDENTSLYLKGSYNRLEDIELSSGFFIIADDDELYQNGVFDPEGGTVYQVRSEYEESVFTNSTLTVGGTTSHNNFTFDYSVGYARGIFEEPNDYEVAFEYELSGPVLYDYSDNYFPQPILSEEDQAAIRDPSNFVLGGNDIDLDDSKDEKYIAQFDTTYEPNSTWLSYIKAGAKYQRSERELFEANVLEAEGDLALVGSGFEGGYLDTSDVGSPYGQILRLNPGYIRNWRNIGQQLVADGILENAYDGDPPDEDSYEAEEDLYAAYLMAEAVHGDFEFIGGVRVEYLDFTSNGFEVIEDEDGETVQARTSTSDNTQILPRIQVNYRPTDKFVVRGAAFTSLARPEFVFLNAATEIEIEDDNSLEAFLGNPDLKPAYAWNFDLSAEYYLSSIGMISGGVFYKSIEDFIFIDSAPEGETTSAELEARFPGYNIEVETVFNGNRAEVYGLELAYMNQFTGLKGPFGGLGVYANLTLQETSADTGLEGRDDVPFFNAPDYVGTVALTYQKYGVEANLAYTFRGDSLEELGPYLIDKYQQSYETLDGQFKYALTEKVDLYVNAIDILDDGLDPVVHKTLGKGGRYPEDITFNGRTVTFGVTLEF
ncbi:TonB-dependent receptor [Ponticaulis profundi]|uniref:TonB-dependent receptor n=1 Tax=Ponticaulis profundi TaxID=2665222 RepID=A0ABW1S9K3_9PROT